MVKDTVKPPKTTTFGTRYSGILKTMVLEVTYNLEKALLGLVGTCELAAQYLGY